MPVLATLHSTTVQTWVYGLKPHAHRVIWSVIAFAMPGKGDIAPGMKWIPGVSQANEAAVMIDRKSASTLT